MQKIKDIRVLTITAMLVAIATVFGFFKVPITQTLEIRFAFLPIAAGGMLFGPAVGMIIGILSDLLGFFVKPTGPFFPGFTISAAISGLLYGVCLYKKQLTVVRVIVTQLLQTLVISLGLNTLNLSILYGNGFLPLLSARLVQNLIMFPINTVMLFIILRSLQQVSKQFLPQE
ncbi:MAG: folate family ECF transporter S component [Lachnospiraceae bacterium]|nr:folate family ECF transporter S component [Lachnospiraceae bacterium]